jgi:hypothetical protein
MIERFNDIEQSIPERITSPVVKFSRDYQFHLFRQDDGDG